MKKVEKFLSSLEENNKSFIFNYSAHIQGNKERLYTSSVSFWVSAVTETRTTCFRHTLDFDTLPTEDLILEACIEGAELFVTNLKTNKSLEWDLYRIIGEQELEI